MAERLGLAHRVWRKVPAGPRRAALHALATAVAPHVDPNPPSSSQGVVIAGEMARISGLGEAVRLLHDGLKPLVRTLDSVELGVLRRPDPARLAGHGAMILHVNAPSIPLMLARAPRDFLRGRRVIGMWNWELERLPASWHGGKRYVHDIWVPSAFTKTAIEAIYPGMVRLVPYPLAALDLPPALPRRERFDLPAEAVVSVVIANLGASFARKNPLGAIAAHRAAFGNRADRILVIKLTGGAAFPTDMALLRGAVGGVGNIRVIDETWSGEMLRALLASSDILVSLHRAEGFGLVPAEAMLRGIATIATGWSGNLEFMDSTSAALVDYRLTPVADPRGIYNRGVTVWAEPNIDHAAALLHDLAENPARRHALAAAGQTFARAALGAAPLAAALAALGIS
ncbi:glycosyltransferase [Acidiphilium sp.]|uniref:glycosyltransferase n=1 Tax=Acidiphilium sp. TaxID=527 RepID=UPI003D03DCCA